VVSAFTAQELLTSGTALLYPGNSPDRPTKPGDSPL
jgi:hypothetical protein